jgi:hypothetical protein
MPNWTSLFELEELTDIDIDKNKEEGSSKLIVNEDPDIFTRELDVVFAEKLFFATELITLPVFKPNEIADINIGPPVYVPPVVFHCAFTNSVPIGLVLSVLAIAPIMPTELEFG